MIQITPQMRVLVAVEPVDFRKGIDGLARLCRDVLESDPFSGVVFVFRSRKSTAIKLLVYDGRGFWLCQMRLSSERFRYWPSNGNSGASELLLVVERAKVALSSEDHEKLSTAVSTLGVLMEELKNKSTSILRLRQMLFGSVTEKTSQVIGQEQKTSEKPIENKSDEAKSPGHGRRSAAAYTGAEKVAVSHASLHTGDCCPECTRGKVYSLSEPAKLIRITGMAPLGATVWDCERLRCNLCGEVYTAKAPEGVGDKKYDETATSMVGLLKYGCGMPFNRIEKLQAGMGIPLPATTQCELVKAHCA